MSDISDSLETNAQQPKRATIDGNTVEQHSLKDQIEADRYTQSGSAITSPKRGITLSQFRHQGTQ